MAQQCGGNSDYLTKLMQVLVFLTQICERNLDQKEFGLPVFYLT